MMTEAQPPDHEPGGDGGGTDLNKNGEAVLTAGGRCLTGREARLVEGRHETGSLLRLTVIAE